MRMLSRAAGVLLWLAMGFPSHAENSAGPPLPPVEEVVRRAVEKAQSEDDNERAFKQRYFYVRTKLTEVRNGDGDLKKHEEDRSVHDPERKPARSVRPPPSVQPGAGPSVRTGQGPAETQSTVRGRAFEKQELLMNADLLKRFVFVLAGRQTVNGRDTWVVDFEPKAGRLPERNLKERFINRAAGRVWLDGEESQLVKADLHLTEKVDVLGGLVGSVWKFNCSIERERTDDGLWFARASSWHLEGREVVVRRTIDYQEHTDGLRRVR